MDCLPDLPWDWRLSLDAKQLRELVVKPALFEIELWSEAAEELVLGTAIVESRLSFIKQLGSGQQFRCYGHAIGNGLA